MTPPPSKDKAGRHGRGICAGARAALTRAVVRLELSRHAAHIQRPDQGCSFHETSRFSLSAASAVAASAVALPVALPAAAASAPVQRRAGLPKALQACAYRALLVRSRSSSSSGTAAPLQFVRPCSTPDKAAHRTSSSAACQWRSTPASCPSKASYAGRHGQASTLCTPGVPRHPRGKAQAGQGRRHFCLGGQPGHGCGQSWEVYNLHREQPGPPLQLQGEYGVEVCLPWA